MSVIKKTFEIELDLKQPLTNYEWRVVSGDTGNVLVITLTDGGEPVDLTDARLVMLFSRGTSIAMQTNVYPDTSITVSGDNNNIITVDLHSGSFAPGFVESYLQISTKSDPDSAEYDVLVTSAKFNFRCDRELFGNEYIMSLDSYSVLNELIDEVQEIIHGQIQVDWNENDPDSPQYIANKPATYAPSAHASSHAAGGADEITPADIGAMAAGATPTPASHAASHASGGADPITPSAIGAMASDAAPNAHASSHSSAGTDPIAPSDIGAAAASSVGAASGIASLDANAKVTASEASAAIVEVTASKTLALTDAGKFQQINSSSAVTITIPASASVAFPTGTEIELCRYGSGSVTVAAASGVTIVSAGSSKAIAERYGCACLKKLGTNTWLLAGDI